MVATTAPGIPRFVVGVDFGTTFTSVAFAHSSSPENVKLVQSWPTGRTGGKSADQVPTELHYTDIRTRTRHFGYEIPQGRQNSPVLLQWFKLLLQESKALGREAEEQSEGGASHRFLKRETQDFSNLTIGESNSQAPKTTPADVAAQILRGLGLRPVDAVADFLSDVRDATMESIRDSWGQDFVSSSKIEYVLSIPAIWTDAAKNHMIQAAERAGYGKHRTDFRLVGEPEAAASYTLKALLPRELDCGATFVICDAGGGTVDLISYKLRNRCPFVVDEAIRGSGDFCGSAYLDRRFEAYIKKKLGANTIGRMNARNHREMTRSWEEQVKFKFGSEASDTEFDVSVHGVADSVQNQVNDGFHSMSKEDVRDIFEPIVGRIIELVKQQVEAVQALQESVSAILLVGGFGSSAYLKKRLQETNFGPAAPDIIQPANACTAVARGALLEGLIGSVVHSRRARRHYGCSASARVCSSMDAECTARKYWNLHSESYFVPKEMTWYVKMNDVIRGTKSISFPFLRAVAVADVHPSDTRTLMFRDELYTCERRSAPDYIWRRPDAVQIVCTLESDLSRVPISKFEKEWGSGVQWYIINYNLRMTIENEVIAFELLFGGRSYGRVSTKFDSYYVASS